MGVYEARIKTEMDALGWPVLFTSAVAGKFSISGCSQSSLNTTLNGAKQLPTQSAMELYQLLRRFRTLDEQFSPFRIRLDTPDEAKRLLLLFETGAVAINVYEQGEV